MFIVQILYKDPISRIDELLEEHRRYLCKYYDLHKFLMSGPQVPRNGGIIMANTSDLEELHKIINEDPFKREEAAHYTVIEFNPTMYITELSFLTI